MHEVFKALTARGWSIQFNDLAGTLLPAALQQRYPEVPEELVAFLAPLKVCRNSEQNSWFLTADDFLRQAPAFRWNEYECMALETLTSPEERAAVTSFWDRHLPFMLAVHSDYDYLAMQVSGPAKGAIVHGFAPEWEDPSVVAPSLSAFLRDLAVAAGASEPAYPFSIFL